MQSAPSNAIGWARPSPLAVGSPMCGDTGGEISEISEISAVATTCDRSALAKSAKKSPRRYAVASRYTRSGAPGAPSVRVHHSTVILGGVQASSASRLASIRALGTLPRKHSTLIWLRVA